MVNIINIFHYYVAESVDKLIFNVGGVYYYVLNIISVKYDYAFDNVPY